MVRSLSNHEANLFYSFLVMMCPQYTPSVPTLFLSWSSIDPSLFRFVRHGRADAINACHQACSLFLFLFSCFEFATLGSRTPPFDDVAGFSVRVSIRIVDSLVSSPLTGFLLAGPSTPHLRCMLPRCFCVVFSLSLSFVCFVSCLFSRHEFHTSQLRWHTKRTA
jgi:hypothetical protein